MEKVNSSTYLGGIINKKLDNKEEIAARIAATMPVLTSLDLFWKKAKVSLKWKLEVYNAVVVSKLIYGLETLQFNNSTFNKINSFQMKGLRKIMNIPPTFIDRSTTDDMVFNICNEEIAKNSKSKPARALPSRYGCARMPRARARCSSPPIGRRL